MRKRTKLLSGLVALASVMIVLATGCGTPSGTTNPATGTTPQVYRVNLQGEPATIDPNRASWAQERTIILQVFEGLLNFNTDLTLRPDVAKEIPTVANKGISADGLTYTFNLNPNAVWSDGKKVVAGDFEYSIKRMLSPQIASDYASFYFAIAGAEAYNASGDKDAAAQQQLKDAVGVKAVNDSTLKITLAQQSPTFLQVMALWPAYPVRQDIIEKYGDQWTEPPNYIGNGAYLLTEWVHQDHLTLTINPNYWGTKPFLTEIDIKEITDINASVAAYKNSELDMSGVSPGTEKATMADSVLGPEVKRNPELVTFGFRYNVAIPPFDNVKVRQAIATAIDRNAFIEQVRGGVGKPATSWIPPGMPGYDSNLGTQYAFSPTKAKQLLADAGYPDASKLPTIKFQYGDTAGNKVIAQFLQAQMKDNLGINITLEPMESKAFNLLVNNKQFTWAWYGWGADYPDPDNWLPQLFGTGAGNNKQNYSNPQFDSLSKQALAELDNTKRLQEWAQAQKIVVDDAAMAWMLYRERFVVVKPWVKGLTPTGMDGGVMGDMFWSKIYIQK